MPLPSRLASSRLEDVRDHTTADLNPPVMNGFVKTAHQAGLVFTPRAHTEVQHFFDGMDLIAPGVGPVLAWRPDQPTPLDPYSVYIHGAVGRRRTN